MRTQQKKVMEAETLLKSVKTECIEAMTAKEHALAQQFKQFEGKNMSIQAEMEALKQQLAQEKRDL